jgi:hypothetical protein
VSVDELCKSGKADLQLFIKVHQSRDSGGSSKVRQSRDCSSRGSSIM